MSVRFSLVLISTLMLAACTNGNTPERYAFWRDDNAPPSSGHKPNLGDVPAQPNVTQTKSDMEEVRQRLTHDRDAAYQQLNAVPAPITSQPMAAPAPQNWSHGNVMYNYDSSSMTSTNTNPYIYGYSNVQMQQQQMQPLQLTPPPAYVSNDPSISIDWGALNAAPAPMNVASNAAPMPSTVMVGQPVVFFSYGSARLSPHDKKTLKTLAEEIKAGGKNVVIVGHASKKTGISNIVTSREVNLKMSTMRAAAVLKELARLGVSGEKIQLAAYGDTLPLDGTSGGDTDADQRVELVFNY